MHEIKLYLFVGKVRYILKSKGADHWTPPALFTDVVVQRMLEDENIAAAQLVPLEGKQTFTISGVGDIKTLDLVME